MLYVVRYRSLRRADQSFRGVLPTVVRRCVWSRNLVNEKALIHWGAVAPKTNKQKNKQLHFLKMSVGWDVISGSHGQFITDSPHPNPTAQQLLLGQLFTITHTLSLGRTLVDEWSARHRDLYVIKLTRDRQTSMPRWDSNPQSQQTSGHIPTP